MSNRRLLEVFDSVFPAVFSLLFVAALLVFNRQRDDRHLLHLETVVTTRIIDTLWYTCPMPAGRPTKYTPQTVKIIVDAIALGAPYNQACNAAGISHETFGEWRRIYPEFLDAIKEAEGRGVQTWLKVIEDAAANGNWQAAAWKLERRLPADFGRRDRLPIDVSALDRQFEAEMAQLESAGEGITAPGDASEAVN